MKNVNFASLMDEAIKIESYQELPNKEVIIDEWTGLPFKKISLEEEEEFEEENFDSKRDLTEIKLYDYSKSIYENFEDDSSDKYILFRIRDDGWMNIVDKERLLPTPQSKCVVNLSLIEDFGSDIEFMPVAFHSFMGIEVINFIKYRSDFFSCDERVMFITMLVKFKSFDFKAFYWSREVIFKELGIKKDRANKIIKKFIELGIITTEIRKSVINNRPHQITYFNVIANEVIKLLPKIIIDNSDGEYDVKIDIEKYLNPALK